MERDNFEKLFNKSYKRQGKGDWKMYEGTWSESWSDVRSNPAFNIKQGTIDILYSNLSRAPMIEIIKIGPSSLCFVKIYAKDETKTYKKFIYHLQPITGITDKLKLTVHRLGDDRKFKGFFQRGHGLLEREDES